MLTQSSDYHQTNLFGTDLLMQLDPNDHLIQLANVIPWTIFEQEFEKYYEKISEHQVNPSDSWLGCFY